MKHQVVSCNDVDISLREVMIHSRNSVLLKFALHVIAAYPNKD